ncbi:MAG: hypothetical protein LBE14_00135 [Treponema sp.]|jgi:hypothetical protein|nr:hypothetical protein [Treponema sp.]
MVYKNAGIIGLTLLVLPALILPGAEITVPRLELASRGASEADEFAVSTNAAIDIALNGGYKYGILLGLSFESANLGKAFSYRNFGAEMLDPAAAVTAEEYNRLADRFNNRAVLSFRLARATVRELFKLPLEFSYFAGLSDAFCSGEEFARRYGLSYIETDFTGFYYFPEGIGGNPYRRYNGIHAAQGTGFSLALTRWENFVPLLYLYQDIPYIDAGGAVSEKTHYSGDFRALFNGEKIKIEAFGGMSAGKDIDPDFRGGLLAFFTSGRGADFLIQCGIPGWVQGEEFSIDNLYFLMEPRLSFGLFAVHVNFFYHPLEYLHIKTEEERGKADINIKFLMGNMERFRLQGGLETTVGLKADGAEDFSFKISPFISLLSEGLRWDLKLRFNPLTSERPEEITEIFVGIRTAY